MSVRQLHNGAWEVSDLIDGRLVTRVYYGYTKRDAVREFARDTREGHMKRNPPLVRVESIGSNQTEVKHGLATILFSYRTPVAVWFPGEPPFVSSTKHSTTTSRHINQWIRHHGFSKGVPVPQGDIDLMAEEGHKVELGQGYQTPIERNPSHARTRSGRIRELVREGYPDGHGQAGAIAYRETRAGKFRANPRGRSEYPPIGSISTGTLNVEDLLSEYASTLRVYDTRKTTKALLREYDAMDEETIASEEGDSLLQEMEEALGDIAPPYSYFGALEGDPADIGFWPNLEEVENAVYDGDVLKVDDFAMIPRGYVGDVMQVSDHGNVTVGRHGRGGKWTEYWSIV
jgi:hypothetical protein